MFANKYRLDNVIGFVDRNYLQTDGHSEDIMPLDPLRPKWESFGWRVYEIDGHDFEEIIETVEAAQEADRPVMIIARTIKGKGVSFMENEAVWHGTPPELEDYDRAMAELGVIPSLLVILRARWAGRRVSCRSSFVRRDCHVACGSLAMSRYLF